jgi:hypothetical protein
MCGCRLFWDMSLLLGGDGIPRNWANWAGILAVRCPYEHCNRLRESVDGVTYCISHSPSKIQRSLHERSKKRLIWSQASVTKMRVWIGESVYWIFTSRNYIKFLHSQAYWNIAHVMSHNTFSNPFLATPMFPWDFGTQVNSITILLFPHIISVWTRDRKEFYCCAAQTTQRTNHVIAMFPVFGALIVA